MQSSNVVLERRPVTEQPEGGFADLTPENKSPLEKRKVHGRTYYENEF